MLIRTAESRDVAAITTIYGHYVRHSTATFEIDPPDQLEMEIRLNAVLAAGLPYLVAERDAVLLGFAYAGQYRPRPAYRFTVEDSVYLSPGAVGQGIGTRLLAQLMTACQEAEAHQMVAVIGDQANNASIRLHLKLGFRQAGLLQSVGLKFGRWVDTVLMQRQLST